MEGWWEDVKRFCRTAVGLPEGRASQPSYLYHFTSEREFVELLHEGDPVVVAFTISCPHARYLDKALEAAAAEWEGRVKFLRVECPKYPGFCITRQRKDYPFIEIFQSSQQAPTLDEQRSNIIKYSVKVMPYMYDPSPYGFREFFKRYNDNFSHLE
eukprot:TRINITY_DN11535_c0_g1_i1.p1 TRINITY_DN11535_c0_g1~~TRINITY_DN11535_c0_g1_i1.p1  ORF type:complete len:156 (-),score=34.59 TRINITY_DN11535_c0_g1_i1:209-676(-)